MASKAGEVKPFAFKGGMANGDDGHDGDHSDGDDDGAMEFRLETLLAATPNVRRRIAALRKLQMGVLDVEAEFFNEVHALECKYDDKFAKLHTERANIIKGAREVTDEEAQFPLFTESESELAERFSKQASLSDAKATGDTADKAVKGVPEFWLTVLRNVDLTGEMIQEHDEEVLKHLQDVRVKLVKEPMSFVIEFDFAPNPYFTNTTLSKSYRMSCAVDPKEPAEFDGPEIVSCTGCAIDWLPEKNITRKLVKKKQKNKKQPSQSRFVTKEVKADSFFNFFEPPAHEGTIADESLEDTERMLLHLDFELGQTLRDHVVPHAVFHYTREATDLDDDEDFEDEDDMDDDSEEGDEEEE